VALAAAALSCRPPATTYIDPAADFSLIQRVAVLPLENLTGDPAASEKVRQLLIIELLSTGTVEVVDVGEVARAIRTLGVINPISPGTEEIQKLGADLKAQALLGGSVQEFAEGRSGGAQSTSVALVFRMVETDTGQTVWSSSVSHSGVGATARLFGVGGDSPTERARKLIADALDTLIQ
jgi:hypothetical protein